MPHRHWCELPDDFERREHFTSPAAWSDYWGRVLELEIHGFTRDHEETTEYGKSWAFSLLRGHEWLTVAIERTA
jgi:hypothetical protein